jgi:hypothetical protein
MRACVGVRAVRIALLGGAVLGLTAAPVIVGEAVAKVGVTSATDGDPLGKPPREAERVLRIGIDVQANELITTSATDRAHLVFLDGSSLTVGPDAQLTIDKFVFDPNTKTGELAINASKGVLRLVGGKISKNGPIVINTPANTVGIRGGITILDVQPGRTDATFVFGKEMTVTGGGVTQVATRPGSQIVTNVGNPPGLPAILGRGALAAQLGQLEGKSTRSNGGGGSGSTRNPDQVAQASGFSGTNSSQPVRFIASAVPDNSGSGPGPRNRNPNDTIVTALSDANQSVQTDSAAQEARSQSRQQQQQTSGELPNLPPIPGFDFSQFNVLPNSRISTVNELNNLNLQRATATYTGPVYALTSSSPGQVVGGTYTNAWNFGNRNGVVQINIDNSSYGGGSAPNVFLRGNGPSFGTNGSLAATSGPAGRSATVDGVFLSSPGAAANQQIGVIGLSGPNNYQGVGVFSARK